MNNESIIIGAGAAGLLCALELARAGKKVTVLEANGTPGGRMHTLHGHGFTQPVEAGAEFIHGDLPVTLGLVKEAGLAIERAGGQMIQLDKGKLMPRSEGESDWDEMMEKMQSITGDMPFAAFLQQFFAGDEYTALRKQATRFAQGFDLADINRVSTKALAREWADEDDGHQHRIPAGYSALAVYLQQQAEQLGVVFHFNTVAQTITWQPGKVAVQTTDGVVYEAAQTVITIPVSLLSTGAAGTRAGAVQFQPALNQYHAAAADVGYGSVIKILLQFSEAFWLNIISRPGFFLTPYQVPTWWTQGDAAMPLLTGWLNGSQAGELLQATNEQLLTIALDSLSGAFAINRGQLQQRLTAWHVANWHTHPFAAGAYSYDTPETAQARNLLCTPVANTIYFAGEALYRGNVPGTVEAAFESARITAKQCLLSTI
ncbi:flavin monoamine oxidase family protein [Deminuibacter soli]|nr:NAD(P)/FAD-dependent oxidoreductase [Deminuibacter soli]